MVQSTSERLVLKDNKGGFAVIEFAPPDKPKKGLGFLLCPNGDQSHQFKATYEAMESLCNSVAGANLSEREARQALYQRLVPKLQYPLHLTSFSTAQCNRLNSLVRKTFLPAMRMNRNMPNAFVFGPLEYGGMEYPEAYCLQDQTQCSSRERSRLGIKNEENGGDG